MFHWFRKSSTFLSKNPIEAKLGMVVIVVRASSANIKAGQSVKTIYIYNIYV